MTSAGPGADHTGGAERRAEVDTTAQDDAARDEDYRGDTSREPAGDRRDQGTDATTTSEEQTR